MKRKRVALDGRLKDRRFWKNEGIIVDIYMRKHEDLTVGMSVKRGDCIATVAEATGEEYKDGAHLHFEIKKDGKIVDPAAYLTFEEK